MRTETVLFLVIAGVTAAAFGIETLGPDGARIVGIVFCLLLLSLMVGGLIARRQHKRRREQEMVAQARTLQAEAAAASDQEAESEELPARGTGPHP